MTPIDNELRTTLHRRAGTVAPPADPLAGVERRAGQIRRRRMATAALATATAVVVVVVAGPAGLARLSDGHPRKSGFANSGTPSATTPTAAPSVNQVSQPPAVPGWQGRGSFDGSADFTTAIGRQWSAAHNSDSAGKSLWLARLPGGDGEAGIFQFWSLGSPTAYTVVGQRLPDGRTFIVRDTVTPPGAKQFSAVLQGGAFPHVVVLGPPGAGQISYAADGRRFLPVERLQGFAGGDGWAVFDRTGPAVDQKSPDLVEVLGGDGRLIFRGQIEAGPSFPDV